MPNHADTPHPVLEDDGDTEPYDSDEHHSTTEPYDSDEHHKMQDQLHELTRRLDVEVRNNADAHAEMRKVFRTLHADFQKCDPKSTYLENLMRERIDTQVDERVSWETKSMQKKIEGLVQSELNQERRAYHNAHKHSMDLIRQVQEQNVLLHKLSEATISRTTALEDSVTIINNESERRQNRKNKPLYKKAFGLHADAAALPALLARL